jgi:hypothetical protein
VFPRFPRTSRSSMMGRVFVVVRRPLASASCRRVLDMMTFTATVRPTRPKVRVPTSAILSPIDQEKRVGNGRLVESAE